MKKIRLEYKNRFETKALIHLPSFEHNRLPSLIMKLKLTNLFSYIVEFVIGKRLFSQPCVGFSLLLPYLLLHLTKHLSNLISLNAHASIVYTTLLSLQKKNQAYQNSKQILHKGYSEQFMLVNSNNIIIFKFCNMEMLCPHINLLRANRLAGDIILICFDNLLLNKNCLYYL